VNFQDPAVRANPYPLYAHLRKNSPVLAIRRPLVGQVWLVTRHEDVLTVLQDKRFVNDRRNVGDGGRNPLPRWLPRLFQLILETMLTKDLGDHRRLRALVQQAFTPRRVEEMKGAVEQTVGRLLDAAEKKQTVDLLADFSLPLPLQLISQMMGIPGEDQHDFHRWMAGFLEGLSSGPLKAILQTPKGFRLERLLRKVIRLRREQPQDDLLSALVQAEEQGDRLSEEELLSMVFVLLLAGHETMINLLGNGVLALLQHPDQLEKLRARPELIDTAIEELLRYANSVEEAAPRFTREEVELGGQRIPRGATVIPVLASANRDESVFPNPDMLDITRSPNRHVALGMGVHYCLGAPLARLETRLALLALVQRFPRMRLAVPADKLRWRASAHIRGLEALPLHLM
jgi:cytochrome P450 PksS